MSVKIKLGSRPANFKKIPVKFTLPDGTAGVIGVVFKYRTRSEFAAYLNQLFDNGGDKPAVEENPDFVALFARSNEKTVGQLLDSIDSWDFEYDLNKATLVQLGDEIPSALSALASAYSSACTEGKLGN